MEIYMLADKYSIQDLKDYSHRKAGDILRGSYCSDYLSSKDTVNYLISTYIMKFVAEDPLRKDFLNWLIECRSAPASSDKSKMGLELHNDPSFRDLLHSDGGLMLSYMDLALDRLMNCEQNIVSMATSRFLRR